MSVGGADRQGRGVRPPNIGCWRHFWMAPWLKIAKKEKMMKFFRAGGNEIRRDRITSLALHVAVQKRLFSQHFPSECSFSNSKLTETLKHFDKIASKFMLDDTQWTGRRRWRRHSWLLIRFVFPCWSLSSIFVVEEKNGFLLTSIFAFLMSDSRKSGRQNRFAGPVCGGAVFRGATGWWHVLLA